MSRKLSLLIVLALGGSAAAQGTDPADPAPAPAPDPAAPPADSATANPAPPDMSDQAIGAEVGVAIGSHITPGGLRIAGHYLYQLSAQDWFDGVASFTFGGGSPQCFRDRMDVFQCDHGLAQGDSFEVGVTVRHFLGTNKQGFWPFLRGGVGVGLARFGDDNVSGLILPLHAGAGLRVTVSPGVALTGEAELQLGFGSFNHALGLEPQLGVGITAGAEFRL